MKTAKDYLKTWKASTQGNPYDLNNSAAYNVAIYDEDTGEEYSETIWGESSDQIRNDLTPYLKDPECVESIWYMGTLTQSSYAGCCRVS